MADTAAVSSWSKKQHLRHATEPGVFGADNSFLPICNPWLLKRGRIGGSVSVSNPLLITRPMEHRRIAVLREKIFIATRLTAYLKTPIFNACFPSLYPQLRGNQKAYRYWLRIIVLLPICASIRDQAGPGVLHQHRVTLA